MSQQTSSDDTERHIITPAEAGRMGVDLIRYLNDQRDRMMPLLLPGTEDYFMPLEPGSLTICQARTHNGKSWWMKRWAYRMLAHLKQRGRDEVIVWVDTETSADYLAMAQVASLSGISYRDIITKPGLDMQALLAAAVEVASQPLYTIATRLGMDGSEIHLSNIRRGLKMLRNGQVDGRKHTIAAVFVDYLQSLPLDPIVRKQQDIGAQRRLQVSRDVDTCRVIGSECGCPVILGVQAKQTPDATELFKCLGVPGSPYDGQETANIGQRADRIVALSVAERNFGRGQTLEYHNKRFVVAPNMMFMTVLKQRGEGFPAGATFAYTMDSKATDPMQAMINIWSEV